MSLKNFTGMVQVVVIYILSIYPNIVVSQTPNGDFGKSEMGDDVNCVDILADFEDETVLNTIKTYHNISKIELNHDKSFIKKGESSLKIIVDENIVSAPEGRVVLDLKLNTSRDMSRYRSLTFWLYIPENLKNYFYGRNDVQLFPNQEDPRYVKGAITSGWNKIHWDFKDLYTFPDLKKLRIEIGPILDGFNSGEVYIDEITLERMQPLDVNDFDQLTSIVRNDSDWCRRYLAVEALEQKGEIESVTAILDAIADGTGDFGVVPEVASTAQAVAEVKTQGSQAVRSAAKKALKSKIKIYGDAVKPVLIKGLNSLDMRIRLAVIEILSDMPSEKAGDWVLGEFKRGLFDDVFYIRQASMEALEKRNYNKAKITEYLSNCLHSKDDTSSFEAIRALSEIGPDAKPAIPELLKIVRNDSVSLNTRCWAIKAVWKIDENSLTPDDWIIVLSIKPGDIHRHLFNVAMDRLEKAEGKSVRILADSLKSADPETRARAASVLMAIGPKAQDAVSSLESCLQDKEWYVRWQAAKAIKAILPNDTKADVILAQVQDFKNRSESEAIRAIQKGTKTVLDNGIVQMVFDENSYDPGPVAVRMGDWGTNLFESDWLKKMMAFKDSPADSILERSWFQKVWGTPVNKNFKGSLVASTEDYSEYVYKFPANGSVFIEWTLHYVLRRGESGFYVFVTAKNVSGKNYENSVNSTNRESLGEFRLLIPLTWGMYDTVIMHDKLRGPSKYTFIPHGFMPYPDIYQCSYRVPSGEIDAKHEWDGYELGSPAIGYCNQEEGLWFIMPDFESLDGSTPTLSVHSANRNMFVIHLEGKYYVNTATKITKDFDKFYGPFFFYINSGKNREELWVDAKRKAEYEKSQWPYSWVKNEQYHKRGSVKGKVSIDGNCSPEDSWIILAKPRNDIPEGYYGQWLLNVNPYRYWTKAGADGSFEIKNVRSDNYSIFVWKEGVFGELRKDDIVVHEGKVNDIGLLTLQPIHKGETLWQIGIPNRSPIEYKNGRNFHQWDNYLSYQENFPNDVNYTIGESDYTKDWNYIQPAAVQGQWRPTMWKVNFKLDKEPDKNGLLTVVCAGRYAKMDVVLNSHKIGDITIMVKHVGANIRSAPYDELFIKEFKVKRELLKKGDNTLLFTFAKGATDPWSFEVMDTHFKEWTSYVSYDFIRFEMLDKYPN